MLGCENFLAGRVIYFLCGIPLCGVPGWYNLFGHYPGVGGGTVQIFPFSGSVVAGTVRLKWWGGGPFFLSFSSLCCQLFWHAVVCGRAPFFFIDFLLGYILIRFAVSYFISC